MSTDLKTPPDASVTTLVSGIIHDAQELIRQQLELLKHEVKSDLRKTRDASLLMIAGGGVAAVAILLLAFSLVYLVNWAVPALPLWASFGICGLVLAAAGGGLIYAGYARFESFNPLPDESARALKENVQWIQKQL